MDDAKTEKEDSSVSVTLATNLVQIEHHAKVTHNPTIQTVRLYVKFLDADECQECPWGERCVGIYNDYFICHPRHSKTKSKTSSSKKSSHRRRG